MKGFKKSFKSKRRKKLRIKFLGTGLLCFLVISGLVYLIFFSGLFTLSEIVIENNKEVSGEEIKNVLSGELGLGKNIFFSNIQSASSEVLTRMPKISRISIKRNWPSRVTVEIEERKPAAILYGYYMDKEGVIFEKAPEGIRPFPVILIKEADRSQKEGDSPIPKEIALKVTSIITRFEEYLKIPVESISLVFDYRADVKTIEGWQAYFNLEEDVAWQTDKLKTVLEEKVSPERRKKLEYIDLRFEKIYLYPEETVKEPS